MNARDLSDFLWNVMELKHYGKTYFKEDVNIQVWKGNTTVEKNFIITLTEREGIPKNSEYFKKLNKVCEAFDIDYNSDNGTISFRLMNVKRDKRC